jgi:hypothetical protein
MADDTGKAKNSFEDGTDKWGGGSEGGWLG